MATVDDVRGAPPFMQRPNRLIRWICTNNPFYVLSAGLFLFGLRISFGTTGEVDTWALMSGLAGYTLLLAVTACLLVRFGNVWDDVRTVLLLVVLMFLATSVTFDEVLVLEPIRGTCFNVGGLLFAIAVSEILLRGIRLALPAWFRVPYYLILAVFFLYPLALNNLIGDPHSETLMWGVFGFSSVAGLAFLTLLPAIRRGPGYVRDNGSPWNWPLYPWTLFGMLGCAVPARAFLLCYSMHRLEGPDGHDLMFGPYFLVPFGFAVCVLLLEIGLVSKRRNVLWLALAAPAGLLILALVGHRPDPIYREFTATFAHRLGGDPLFATLLAGGLFYAYAALRRVPLATEALTAVLAALTVVGPNTLAVPELSEPRLEPLLAAAALQLLLGMWHRASWRCLLGTAGLIALAALVLPQTPDLAALQVPILFHFGLLGVMLVGAMFNDALAHLLRLLAGYLVLTASLGLLFGFFERPPSLQPWLAEAYPLLLAAILTGYGYLLRHRVSFALAAIILIFWTALAGWNGYLALRLRMPGLDYISVSWALFGVAILVSLLKSTMLKRPLAPPAVEATESTG